MAKATTVSSLTSTWTKIADSGQTFMFSVRGGVVLLHYSSSSPSVDDGHPFYEGDTYGDTSPTQNAWLRAATPAPSLAMVASPVTAVVVVSKE